MKFKARITIGARRARILNGFLASVALQDHGTDDVIDVFTARFGDGSEADIKVCNGEPSPWIDAVLFDEHGVELAVMEPRGGPIEGEYWWQIGPDHYRVSVAHQTRG